jgi:hypothetical protein
MYPGDQLIDTQATSQSMVSVERYQRDLQSIEIDPMPESKSMDEIVAAAEGSNAFLREKFPR